MVDALVSNTCDFTVVRVRVSLPAHIDYQCFVRLTLHCVSLFCFSIAAHRLCRCHPHNPVHPVNPVKKIFGAIRLTSLIQSKKTFLTIKQPTKNRSKHFLPKKSIARYCFTPYFCAVPHFKR